MISCFSIKPDRIVFIGENAPMEKQKLAYYRFLKKKELDVTLDFIPIKTGDLNHIVSVLSEIVESTAECAFDLTGGSDLVLVAMGMVYQKYRLEKRLQMHRFNVRTGSITDCDYDGALPQIVKPTLSVEENIMLYGGLVVQEDADAVQWQFDDELKNDIIQLWDICKVNPGLWNSQINTIERVVSLCKCEDSQLTVALDKSRLDSILKTKGNGYKWSKGLLRAFSVQGFLLNYSESEERVCFTFKNKYIRYCLTKSGALLELVVLMLSRELKTNKGNVKFDDAKVSVSIDWDATIHDIKDEEKDTKNEIDVILMCGVVPVFISCKNGGYDENELYKLDAVCSRFGGPFAKKVLVATYGGKNSVDGHKYLMKRAEDMGILLIEDVHNLSLKEFEKKLRSINC